MNVLPECRRLVAIGARLHTSSHDQHLTMVAGMSARGLEARATRCPRHGERLQSGLPQQNAVARLTIRCE